MNSAAGSTVSPEKSGKNKRRDVTKRTPRRGEPAAAFPVFRAYGGRMKNIYTGKRADRLETTSKAVDFCCGFRIEML